jgi:hypothetical protein
MGHLIACLIRGVMLGQRAALNGPRRTSKTQKEDRNALKIINIRPHLIFALGSQTLADALPVTPNL